MRTRTLVLAVAASYAAAVSAQSVDLLEPKSRVDVHDAVVLPDTGGEGAFAVGERIRERIAAFRFLLGDGLDIHLTVSIGVATNNVAEYRGLIAGLEWARAHGYSSVHVRSDSLLLVQQMRGHYRVKHPGLQPLHAKAGQIAQQIGRVTFEHVGRSLNAHADRLANAAMDDAAKRPATPGE